MAASSTSVAARYARDVVSGKIPAAKYVRLACQRHLDDIASQKDKAFRFKFDPKAAERVCKFIQLMPHTKGEWARQGKTLILEPWQVFFIAVVFGWMRKSDGTRRYRKALLLVPRKNGKSALAAGIGLYMLLADKEFGAEVYSGATTEKQAWEVFRPARLMAQKQTALRDHYGLTVNAKNLHLLSNDSRFEPVIGNPGDGASPSCAIVDEYHEHDTDALFATMETGMGAREQPLMLVITTAGDNIAGPCYAMQDEAQKELEGTRPDSETFALIYGIDEGDDWTSPDVIRKANPNFGVSIKKDFLLAQQREAMNTPRKAGMFKTKHLNVWVQSRAAYYNVLRYQKAADPTLTLDMFVGQECIIGIDLAEKRDLTAVELVFRYKDGFACFGRYYCPAETIDEPHNEHFQTWRDSPRPSLIETDGAVTDDRVIEADLEDCLERFDVRELVFDPWHSRQMAVQMMEKGVTCVEFGNRPSTMNEPMRAMDALIAEGRMYHDGDPAFTWMLSNVVNGTRTSDLHRPAKERGENKIDGPVARIMALGRWLIDEDEGPSVYEDRGILMV
ncbi:terminase large subunit [Falsirhodobacter halotolerans]|uniref:terminase large subunit n=1 Tax=Falsirhodobacter halotolerans TaxID=1146892 RepID=UPI001FD1AB62|nr:terminase TerL endonuclease subunit [Falsirhodobacter halotolerans]MCJ8139574.1 terminase large subunit [Falsirhodobacter halotolerans]